MSKKIRADELLVLCGLVESRTKAQACILAGQVRFRGEKVQKSSQLFPSNEKLSLDTPMPYVGRGGLKMENFIKEMIATDESNICILFNFVCDIFQKYT